ncbi:serine/threonine protein kinase [Pyxidicoccus parkwayensis]|uniref:Serine/threonine protein kinase n=2 Tax=Pyxidicoccus parkwayensis TaxID=2813578 RepID=A0ABX7PCX9_9BACT|nr:serine/threonine protein kinase [Pyxidicoccus parkwaysis]
MEMGKLNPAYLPPGTQVGPWRVLEQRGRGACGAVYRAERVDLAEDIVALKVALHPWDARFAREAELLSRIRHPAVPGLRGHGQWQNPVDTPYAWLAMELIEGIPLYEWARAQRPTSRQVLQLLARLARALDATHSAGGLHRDVKGSNVLVRQEDGQAFLMDFGSGHHLGARTLTWQPFPPGTPAYRAPEAWRFAYRQSRKARATPYAPAPADDVFALGVTAYRLIAQRYLPSAPPEDAKAWRWIEDSRAGAPRVHNERCAPELDALVARMLALRPDARGSARELAEALERAAASAGAEADVPLFTGDEPRPLDEWPVRRVEFRPRRKPRRPWLAVAGMGGLLALGVGWHTHTLPEMVHAGVAVQQTEDAKDGGTTAVGDSALTAPVSLPRAPLVWSTISVDLPPRPLPGQTRPDTSGRCPGRSHVAINGGCWKKLSVGAKDCDEDYVYKGGCYSPAFPPARPATSNPTEPHEGQ